MLQCSLGVARVEYVKVRIMHIMLNMVLCQDVHKPRKALIRRIRFRYPLSQRAMSLAFEAIAK